MPSLCWRVLAIIWLAAASASAQTATGESGKYRLFKFEQAIGEETYRIERTSSSVTLTDNFLFTDRGSAVPLTTTFIGAPDLTPRSFESKGKGSRLSSIDVSMEVHGTTAAIREMQQPRDAAVPAQFFAVNGYSPVAQQMLMIRYWLSHNSPAALSVLPERSTVHIMARGFESVTVNGALTRLTKYSVAGVIWGREVLWLDPQQRLVAAVTIDAEFDHFEATAEGYEALLPKFVAEAGEDGMAVLAELSKGLRAAQTGPLAIVGARLVDGTGTAAVADATVVIDRGRIVAAGPRERVAVPAGATVFDAKGKTLLPGLWDMHAHFEQVEWGPIYLAAGVTTVRDVGNELEFITAVRDAIAAGRGLGPQLLLAGIVDGTGPLALGVERVDTPEDATRWVREYKSAGFLQMKIYSSVKLPELKAVCDAAHAAGMTVTGHIPAGMTMFQAIEAGMDQVNHIQYPLAAAATPPAAGATREQRLAAYGSVDFSSPEAQRMISFLEQHDTVIDPTLALMEMNYHPASQPVSEFEPGVLKVAPELAQPLTSGGMPADAGDMGRRVLEKMVALVGVLHKAGVRVVAGTDQAVPGHSLHRELELYVQAGFTPMEAIQAATLVPAKVMGVDKEVGTIEVNKRADLILLDANPLDDIHNIRSVSYVVANGALYPTSKLWESVGFKP
jgi:imidazolonepropionase-like amidohydrolase